MRGSSAGQMKRRATAEPSFNVQFATLVAEPSAMAFCGAWPGEMPGSEADLVSAGMPARILEFAVVVEGGPTSPTIPGSFFSPGAQCFHHCVWRILGGFTSGPESVPRRGCDVWICTN